MRVFMLIMFIRSISEFHTELRVSSGFCVHPVLCMHIHIARIVVISYVNWNRVHRLYNAHSPIRSHWDTDDAESNKYNEILKSIKIVEGELNEIKNLLKYFFLLRIFSHWLWPIMQDVCMYCHSEASPSVGDSNYAITIINGRCKELKEFLHLNECFILFPHIHFLAWSSVVE